MTRRALSKRCGCRDPETRKQLGAKCPKLRRKDGSWNPLHGTYRYQIDLPPAPDGSRRLLRRAGFGARDDALADRDRVRALITAAGSDRATIEDAVAQILGVRQAEDLPNSTDAGDQRRIDVGIGAMATVKVYLQRWLSRLDVGDRLLHRHRSHCERHLIPLLGEVRVSELTAEHVRTAMNAIQKSGGTGQQDSGKRRIFLPLSVCAMIQETLRSAMDAAVAEGIAAHNPVFGQRMPDHWPPTGGSHSTDN